MPKGRRAWGRDGTDCRTLGLRDHQTTDLGPWTLDRGVCSPPAQEEDRGGGAAKPWPLGLVTASRHPADCETGHRATGMV